MFKVHLRRVFLAILVFRFSAGAVEILSVISPWFCLGMNILNVNDVYFSCVFKQLFVNLVCSHVKTRVGKHKDV